MDDSTAKSLEDIEKRVEHQEAIHSKDMTFNPTLFLATANKHYVPITIIAIVSTTLVILYITAAEKTKLNG